MNTANDLQIQVRSLKIHCFYLVCIHGKDDLGLMFVQDAECLVQTAASTCFVGNGGE